MFLPDLSSSEAKLMKVPEIGTRGKFEGFVEGYVVGELDAVGFEVLGAIDGFAGLLEGEKVEGFMDGHNGICDGFIVGLKLGFCEVGL